MKNNILAVARSARLTFLLLTFSVVILTVAMSAVLSSEMHWYKVLLMFVGASFAHLAVNFLNEYQDYQSGLDKLTTKTAFSGGSGALVENPQAAKWVLSSFWISLSLVIVSGLLLSYLTSWLLLVFGLLGVALIVFYTHFITRLPWLCLIAPGLAFGPIFMVGGSFAITGQLQIEIMVLSLLVFFLVNNLLLLNQIPDIEADQQVGRDNVLMRWGVVNGLQVFAAFAWMSFITLGLSIWLLDLPDYAWLGFLPLMAYFPLLRDVQIEYENLAQTPRLLGLNVVITLLTPVFIAFSFIIL